MPTFSNSLEQALHRALSFANDRKHEYATLEHLLLALITDDDAANTMRACNVDLNELTDIVTNYLDNELSNLVSDDALDSKPTTDFQRVIQRAVIHIQSSGRDEVNGANVLVAIFAEHESHAVYFLHEQEMTRFDAVNYISHGIPKRLLDISNSEDGDLSEQPLSSESKTLAQLVYDEIDELRGRDTSRVTSLTTIANGVHISPRTLQKWNTGEVAEPKIQTVIQIFVFLGLTESEAGIKFSELTRKFYNDNDDDDPLNQRDTKNLDLAARSDIGNQDQDMAVFHKLIRHSVKKPEKFIFISHSNNDNEITQRYIAEFQHRGFKVWWDGDILPSQKWSNEIERHLDLAAAVVVLWTKNSVQSDPVCEEARIAQSNDKLIGVRLDSAPLKYGFSETQYVSISPVDDFETSVEFAKVISAIKDLLDPPSSAEIIRRVGATGDFEATIRDGKVEIVDSPANVAPPSSNEPDKVARLRAQARLTERLMEAFEPQNCNLPKALSVHFTCYFKIINEDACWYSLDDIKQSIASCMDRYQDMSWPDSGFDDVKNFCDRHESLEPLIRPAQLPPKPANEQEFAPQVNVDKVVPETLETASDALEQTLNEGVNDGILGQSTLAAVEHFGHKVEDVVKSELNSEEDQRAHNKTKREALYGLLRVAGTVSAGVTVGIATNVLTAQGASKTLLDNLQQVIDLLLKLF